METKYFICRSFDTTSMGKPERKGRERTCSSSSSYFLRCFGISLKTHIEKPMVETGHEKKSKKKKTTSRWFSRGTRFRLEDGEITTKPVYETEKQNLTIEDDKQNLFRVIRQVTDRKNIAAVGHETKEEDTSEQRDINPEPLSYEDASSRVIGEPTKTVGSGSKRKELREKSSRVRKIPRVDPVIGISIILLTLMIMLMWGRLCAILCTSAWCYFLPLLKEAAKRKRSGAAKAEGFPDDLDINSEAYKKKVVMQGFLLRQRPRFAVTTF